MQSSLVARSFFLPLALTFTVSALSAQDPGETWQVVATGDLMPPMPPLDPQVRIEYMTAFFAANGTSILFGGENSGGVALAGTWAWDGKNWTEIVTQSSPSPRSHAAMAYDPIRERIVLFGGVNGDAAILLGDTWEFDGLRWTLLTPATRPPPLIGAQMAWDPASEKLLMYGGGTKFEGDLGSETWLFDGTDWERQTPGQNPGPLKDHRMVTDTKRDRIVLFGGIDVEVINVSQTRSSRTWEWSNGNWIFQNRVLVPTARRSFGMAFDSVRGITVVSHGTSGRTGGLKFADTWTWDGSAWSNNIFLDPKPQARGGVQMVENPNSGRMMLYGGSVAQASPGETLETWEFFGPGIAQAPPFGQGCQGTNLKTPLLQTQGGSRPKLGTQLTLQVSNLPITPGTATIGIWGLSDHIWKDTGFVLPDDLRWIGMPGCNLLISLDHVVPLTTIGSTANWTLNIPDNVSLVGLEFFLQGLVLDPMANTLGLTVSNGIAGKVGIQ